MYYEYFTHHSKWTNNYIWPLYKTLKGNTILSQGRTGCNGNKGVLHIP